MSEEIQKHAPNPLEQEKKGDQAPAPKPTKDDEDAELQKVAKAKAAESKNEDG